MVGVSGGVRRGDGAEGVMGQKVGWRRGKEG